MQSGKLRLVFVRDDAAQITKISKKQQKNTCLPSSAHGHDDWQRRRGQTHQAAGAGSWSCRAALAVLPSWSVR